MLRNLLTIVSLSLSQLVKNLYRQAIIWPLGFLPLTVMALTYQLPTGGDNVVGEIQHIKAQAGDTFTKLARRYDIGYYSLVEANPKLNPDRLMPGESITIPSRFILPAAPHTGVVVNLAELRLYYYPPAGKTVETYPVGIGREGWNTPVGLTHITSKDKNPTWYAPESIRAARAAEGVILPKIVPPGPENPLGGYRMRLAITSGVFLMHGTNDASGVGRRSSSGCIRMNPEDVERLYEQITVGTPVRIINDPYKVGWSNGKLYLETHLPLEEQMAAYEKKLIPMIKLVTAATKLHPADINWNVANRVARAQRGLPQVIGIATDNRQSENKTQLVLN